MQGLRRLSEIRPTMRIIMSFRFTEAMEILATAISQLPFHIQTAFHLSGLMTFPLPLLSIPLFMAKLPETSQRFPAKMRVNGTFTGWSPKDTHYLNWNGCETVNVTIGTQLMTTLTHSPLLNLHKIHTVAQKPYHRVQTHTWHSISDTICLYSPCSHTRQAP